jgi:hypothetical protein
MRRRLGYLLAWLLATVVAVTGSWVGLQPLLEATSPQLPSRLAASQLRDSMPSPTVAPIPTAAPTPSAEPSPTTPAEPPPAPLLPATSDWRELPDGDAYERTFIVRGGEVVFRISRRDARVVEHTANPGYEVSVNQWSRSSLILSFESVDHTSRIWVMWRNGPYAEVTETV